MIGKTPLSGEKIAYLLVMYTSALNLLSKIAHHLLPDWASMHPHEVD
jgi:hypothetical protein